MTMLLLYVGPVQGQLVIRMLQGTGNSCISLPLALI